MQINSELQRAAIMCERSDQIKSERDTRWKRGTSRWRRATRNAARLTSKAACIRREALHAWSTSICREAGDLTVISPPVKDMTASPRGTEREPGANVETVSNLNRTVLNQAPAMAVAMLAYKAAEAGIRCDVVTDTAPTISIGPAINQAGRKLRELSRKTRRAKSGKEQQH